MNELQIIITKKLCFAKVNYLELKKYLFVLVRFMYILVRYNMLVVLFLTNFSKKILQMIYVGTLIKNNNTVEIICACMVL